jgi:AcrR family transcriptional regulator
LSDNSKLSDYYQRLKTHVYNNLQGLLNVPSPAQAATESHDMKREKHEVAVRTKIISAARRLFLAQGYHVTTVRQIQAAAEVKTGTIYHFYANKEAIFAHIVLEAFHRVLKRAEALAGDDKPLQLATELAWHVYTMIYHRASAELYLIAYNSVPISAEFLVNQRLRSEQLFGDRFAGQADDEHNFFALLAKGLMQSITIYILNGVIDNPPSIIDKSLRTLLAQVRLSAAEIEDTLAKLHALSVEQHVQKVLLAVD